MKHEVILKSAVAAIYSQSKSQGMVTAPQKKKPVTRETYLKTVEFFPSEL